ncbi:MAG: metal-dependent transcriptional regulator [Anaerolineales bacterium]|nr:metal-dependent transcriptional regulator [Anaerolineales bacterium]
MPDELSHAIQDYLKAIYDLSQGEARANTTELAEVLNVKPASVTGMLRKLAECEPPLVEYEKHRGVVLTPLGEKAALEVIRHHRLLETFLHDTLGFEWDDVHAEADRLEHVISEQFEERIAQVLGHPTHDPHGDPIPDRDLQMPVDATLSLSRLQPGQLACIQRVRDSDPELLRYLAERGVRPGELFTVLERSPFDDNLTLQLAEQAETIVLGASITRQIFVELL